MTENKKETIKNIMQLLDNGFTIYINGGSMWLGRGRFNNKTYIFWQHFGCSANRRNLQELTWIINTIFQCKNKKVVYTYK